MIRLLNADEYSIERDELRQLFADIKVIKDASGSQAPEMFRNDGFGMVIPRVASMLGLRSNFVDLYGGSV